MRPRMSQDELPLRVRSPRDAGPHAAFFTSPLSTMVAPGLTGPTSVRVGARTRWRGPHRLVVRSLASDAGSRSVAATPPEAILARDGTLSLDCDGLEPDTDYAFRVEAMAVDGVLGEGRFRTAPPTSRADGVYRFGILSCNNPFAPDGGLDPAGLRVLSFAERTLRAEGVSRVFWMGDQIYGDLPEPLSLFDPEFFRAIAPAGRDSIFDCSADEVRALYQERHRIFFKPRPLTDLLAGFASHAILDDHEIIDNFGSDPKHHGPRWRAVREGALDAFHDYQARRVFGEARPASFDHGVRHGPIAFYVLDLRSPRTATHEAIDLMGDAQRARLEAFLARNADAAAVVLVLSVPILHVPDWMATVAARLSGEGSDAADRWSCARAQPCRDQLLDALARHTQRHPAQRVLLVGGDIHVGAAMRFRLGEDGRDMLQLVSSAISNVQGRAHEVAAEALPRMRSVMGRHSRTYARAELLEGVGPERHNPYGGLNFGVVEIDARPASDAGVRLRLFGADDAVIPGPRVVFDSGWI